MSGQGDMSPPTFEVERAPCALSQFWGGLHFNTLIRLHTLLLEKNVGIIT